MEHKLTDWEKLTQSKDMSKDALKIIESISEVSPSSLVVFTISEVSPSSLVEFTISVVSSLVSCSI